MKSMLTSAVLLLAVLAAPVAAEPPKVGDKAPDFKLQGSDGLQYSLSQFAGKKAVVIAWFPKAFTGGCTAECKSMKENGEQIRKFDVAYFTASVDDAETNKKFSQSLGLDYPILSDPSKKTAEAYGVVHDDRKVPERWTFYVGPDGIIKAIDQKVNTKEHGNDLARQLDAIGTPKK